LEILRQSVDEAKEKEKQVYDQLLRLGAEFENFRKRSESRVAEARRHVERTGTGRDKAWGGH
jgi:molecular chaperone GrpE (heat shock protein)